MNYRIELSETGQSFEAAAGEPLLEAAERAGVSMRHDCRVGGCGACRVRVLDGSVDYAEEPMALTPEEAAAGHALACQARACGDLVLSVARPGPDVPQPARLAARLASVRLRGASVFEVTLQVDGDGPLVYAPGQYLNVILPDGARRSFSMAAPPEGRRLELHVRRVAGGRFTDGLLPAMRPGDALEIELPHGAFFYHAEDWRPLLMVATGTGLAPIKSILESLMDDPDCPPVSLYWGARTVADLYLHDEIAAWGERLDEFQYVPVRSRAGPDWAGRRGWVQQAVAEDLPDLSEHAIYLCGSPDMIRDATRQFATQGASLAHLYADAFVFQHADCAKLAAA